MKLDPSLPQSFFNREAEDVARDLIGCYFLRREEDSFGRRESLKQRLMWVLRIWRVTRLAGVRCALNSCSDPLSLYLYLIYGLHWMLNVITGPVDFPAAVLMRSVDGICGPGRLSRTLGKTGALNGWVASEPSGLWFARDEQIAALKVARTPRIGVEYAGPIWSAKRYRFVGVIAQ
jgi:DNA-3-methyladenine glycosylase